MANLTVIVGYCGSGKSWWLRQRQNERPDAFLMEEAAQTYPDGGLHGSVVAALDSGRDCFVGLMDCIRAENRQALEYSLNERVPGAMLAWVFYENDVDKANRNCERDPERHRDICGNIEQNLRCRALYSIPPGAIVLPIHELPVR
jgi:hypothetical protein